MIEKTPYRTDDDLLALARNILSESGYAHELVEGGKVLLAENAYCIIALVATPTLTDLLVAESVVEAVLQERIETADIGPKLWDAYLVLLSQERPQDRGPGLQKLFDINYDTRGFRRIARVGVDVTSRGVRNALTPFVDPVRLEDAGLSADPLDALSAALMSHGVDHDLANRAVEVYRQGGRLDDAL